MAISNELFTAILAMDSYNRGYNTGFADFGGVDSQIGNATVIGMSDSSAGSDEVLVDFFAVSYSFDGGTVVSYRGTDNPGATDTQRGDVWSGWLTGFGVFEGSQAEFARDFYQATTGFDPFDEGTVPAEVGSITVTGHSLGGGLAGYISALTGGVAP